MSELEIYKGMVNNMKDDEIKEILKCMKNYGSTTELTLLDYIINLQQRVEQYENPDDLTLFYMWLDKESKDKMKHMENEITQLKQFNQMLTEMGEDYKSRCEKAVEYLKNNCYIGNCINTYEAIDITNVMDILNSRSDE